MAKSILAVNTIFHARMQQLGIKHDQDKILDAIKVAGEKNLDIDVDELNSTINDLIEQDRQKIAVFNQAIMEPQYTAHSAVKVNKLSVIISNGVPKLLADENAISSVLSGKLPGGLDNSVSEALPALGSGEYYGGGNPLYISALLHYTSLALGIGAGYTVRANPAAYYSNPLPEHFLKSADNFSWYNETSHALVVPHGGYAWGGHRNQSTDNPFAPHDCASLTEAYTDPKLVTSTADFMCVWNVNTGDFDGWTPQEWGARALIELYQPIKPEQAQIGDIYFHKLIKATPKDTVYAGGHTAITISAGNKEVETVGANRDLEREFGASSQPGMEGVGLQSFSLQVEGKFIGFLRPNDAMAKQMPDLFGINNHDWSHELVNEHSIVQYYDSHYGHGGVRLSGEEDVSAAAHD